MNADVLRKRERSGSKLQLWGTFIHNDEEQGDQSMTCYAKHIQTLTGNGLIQKIEQMQKTEEEEEKKKH